MQSEKIKGMLKGAPAAIMVSPYFNVADKHYIGRAEIERVLDYISHLERTIAALEFYMDGCRLSKSGVPLCKKRLLTFAPRE